VGGKLFVVVGSNLPPQEALLVTRAAEDAWNSTALFETNLDALENARRPEAFQF
jgi:hypothetical protein